MSFVYFVANYPIRVFIRNDLNGLNFLNDWNEFSYYFNTASANFAPGSHELLHLSSVKF